MPRLLHRLLCSLLAVFVSLGGIAAMASTQTSTPQGKDPAATPPAAAAPSLPIVQLARPTDGTRPRAIVGRCVRGGHAVQDVEVVLHAVIGGGEVMRGMADVTGRFRLPLPLPGDYDLHLRGAEVSRHQAPFRMRLRDAGDALLGDLELRPRPRITGVVIAPDGSTAAGARVICNQSGAPATTATTDAQGRFAIDDVTLGPATIAVTATDADGNLRIAIAGEDSTCEVRLRRLLRARVAFVDDEGKPLAVDVQIVDGKNATPKTTTVAAGKPCELTLHDGATVRVLAPDCSAQELAAATFCGLERVELTRRFALRGSAVGASATATVRLEAGQRASRRQLELLGDPLERDLPVAPDGVFACPELPRGSYRLTLRDGDRGVAPAIDVDLPSTTPIRLQLRPGRPVSVRVLDERGEAMPYAVVRTASNQTNWPSDRTGIAIVACPEAPTTVVVDGSGFLPAAVTIASSATAIDVRAHRAALLAGRVADPSDLERCELRVLAWQRGREAAPIAIPIAADGTFRSGDLEAGNWQLALERRDRTRSGGGARRKTDIPVIAAGIDPRTTIAIAAASGPNADIVVPAPRIAHLGGTVRLAGNPVAGVVVFASSRGDDGRSRTNPLGYDAPLAHTGMPHAVTDANGRFELLAARTGRYELRLRHPAQPVASEPTEVAVTTYDQDLELELKLPPATVRGRWPAANGAADAFLMLVPAAAVVADPFAADQNGQASADVRLRLRLDKDGAFAFAAVPSGDYVLHLCRGRRVIGKQAVRVGAAAVDLGIVAPQAQPN